MIKKLSEFMAEHGYVTINAWIESQASTKDEAATEPKSCVMFIVKKGKYLMQNTVEAIDISRWDELYINESAKIDMQPFPLVDSVNQMEYFFVEYEGELIDVSPSEDESTNSSENL